MRQLKGVEVQAVAQVTQHARGPYKANELLICTDSAIERKIGYSFGSRNTAALTGSMLRHLRGGGRCRLWHNHPSYGSLSITDWRLVLQWTGIEEISALNESGTLFRGEIIDKGRLARSAKPFVNPAVAGVPGAVATTHFEDATAAASSILMSTPNHLFNLYLGCFGTHAVNVALHRLSVIDYSMIASVNDAFMHDIPLIKTTVDSAISAAYSHLYKIL